MMEFSEEQKERADILADWWFGKAREEVNAVVPKAIEYGAADLAVMGEAMLLLLPPEMTEGLTAELRNRTAQEVAVAFYVLGKVARLFGAYAQGKTPSDDTWYDIGVYAKMAQKIRETGEW